MALTVVNLIFLKSLRPAQWLKIDTITVIQKGDIRILMLTTPTIQVTFPCLSNVAHIQTRHHKIKIMKINQNQSFYCQTQILNHKLETLVLQMCL